MITVSNLAKTFTLHTQGGTVLPVMAGASLQVAKGECVGLVGASGAGKSTVLDVISGLLSPAEGQVLVDGINLADLDIKEWQPQIGLVLQATPLFFGSISDNIAVGEKPDLEQVKIAATLASAMSFIQELPDGFATNIGDGGVKLSGGQRQRLAIARAIYKNPSVLILDEATSALDIVNEKAVIETIRSLKGKMTIIIVTHKIETAKMADKAIILDKGNVISVS